MKNLESDSDFRDFIQDDKAFCAVFSADWCPDCMVIKSILPDLEKEYGDRYNFAIVDRDDFMNIAEEYNVLGIPSFIVYKNGKVIDSFISGLRKTRQEITDFLDNAYLKM